MTYPAAASVPGHSAGDPELPDHQRRPTGNYLIRYLTLAVIITLNSIALASGVRPMKEQARQRQLSRRELLWRGTDPAATTVVLTVRPEPAATVPGSVPAPGPAQG